jgi:LytS/YehU family sensor histidine kinase
MLLLSGYVYLNTVLCDVYQYFGITVRWYHAALTILGVTFLTWEGNRLIKPWMKRRFLKNGRKFRFLGTFFLAGNVVAVVAALLMVYAIGIGIYGHSPAEIGNPLKLNVIYATLINLFFHLVNALLFYIREYRQKWQEAEALRRSGEQAQVQLIKSQINPHFLFNNLNVLSGMVIRDNPEANRFIEEFSRLYRYILMTQEKELVELRYELESVEPYLFLLSKRFDNGVRVDIQVPDSYRSWQLIPAALQMLIENAIKHNIVSVQKPLHIMIYANGNQMLTIRNNLQPRLSATPSPQLGLRNICRRYELIGDRAVKIERTEQYFEVQLPLFPLNS